MSDEEARRMAEGQLVERVARELWEAQCAHFGVYRPQLEASGHLCPYDDLSISKQADLRREAHAAITVLRPVLRAEALEEAAKVADWPYSASDGWSEEQAGRIAAAEDIRALMGKK